MKAFGKYEYQASYSTPLAIADLADGLTGTYLGLNGQESALQLTDIFTSSLTGFVNDGAATTWPLAFLNFIYFDNNFRVLDAQKVQIDAAAAFSPGLESMVDFDKLENALDITLPGYLYVYLSNHTPASRVWFDDLTTIGVPLAIIGAVELGVGGGLNAAYKQASKYIANQMNRHLVRHAQKKLLQRIEKVIEKRLAEQRAIDYMQKIGQTYDKGYKNIKAYDKLLKTLYRDFFKL